MRDKAKILKVLTETKNKIYESLRKINPYVTQDKDLLCIHNKLLELSISIELMQNKLLRKRIKNG